MSLGTIILCILFGGASCALGYHWGKKDEKLKYKKGGGQNEEKKQTNG